ncbi:MAG: PH domain-containing protein [Rikenellaceae bacterium]
MPLIERIDDIAAVIALGIPFLFTVLIFATINYTISDGNLIIRTLWFKMATIEIARIRTIKRSYTPLSSPAASLKRLEVKFYHKGRIATALISPRREAEFLAALKAINPKIEMKVAQKQNLLRFWDWDI